MKVLGHVLAVVVAIPLFLAGAVKLLGEPSMAANFVRWGYPPALMVITGILELIAAFMVLLPFSRLVGAGLAISVMVAAAGTHAMSGEFGQMFPPLILGFFAVLAGLVGRR